WYSTGWNRWKLRRSTSVRRTSGSIPRLRAAFKPANPPPTMTTWSGRRGISSDAGIAPDSSRARSAERQWTGSRGRRSSREDVANEFGKPPGDDPHAEDAQDPARHDGELGRGQRGDDRRLEIAEPWPTGDDQRVDRCHPATQPVWCVELDER